MCELVFVVSKAIVCTVPNIPLVSMIWTSIQTTLVLICHCNRTTRHTKPMKCKPMSPTKIPLQDCEQRP